MLPAQNRLRSASEIKKALASGKWHRNDFMRVCIAPAPSGVLKVACVVGKKVSLSAVVRHKYQRWLREAARETVVTPGIISDSYIVIVASPEIRQKKSLPEIITTFQELLTKNKYV